MKVKRLLQIFVLILGVAGIALYFLFQKHAELAKEKEQLSDIRESLLTAQTENAMTAEEVMQLKEKLNHIDNLDYSTKQSAEFAAEVLYVKTCLRKKSKVDKNISDLILCHYCDGEKYLKCSECNGSGKCRNCDGKGTENVTYYLRKASKHFKVTTGYNLRRSYRHKMCGKCGGYRLCTECKGKGKILCKDCNGKYPVNIRDLYDEGKKKIDIALRGLEKRIEEISAKMKDFKLAGYFAGEKPKE